jgi:hypothetical protein
VIAWELTEGEGDWHLTTDRNPYPAMSLCGMRVQGLGRYSQRDPRKIDAHGGERCSRCWSEWRLIAAASLARQDQHLAAS